MKKLIRISLAIIAIIAGARLDAAYLSDPTKFETKFVSESIFK